jgi:hypothetical protein
MRLQVYACGGQRLRFPRYPKKPMILPWLTVSKNKIISGYKFAVDETWRMETDVCHNVMVDKS